MTEALRFMEEGDLVALGIEADAERKRLHPHNIVTYCLEQAGYAAEVVFDAKAPDLTELDFVRSAAAVLPVCAPGTTAVEYLKFLATCRMTLAALNIQVDVDRSGLKVAQLALRFGANDLVSKKPSSQTTEEDIRRVIRDAGFVPKKRDPLYRSLSVY